MPKSQPINRSKRCPWCWWVGPNPCVSMAAAAACVRERNPEVEWVPDEVYDEVDGHA